LTPFADARLAFVNEETVTRLRIKFDNTGMLVLPRDSRQISSA
jgi:hypothetical protein